MAEEPTATLKGTKIEVLYMLLSELNEEIWQQCRKVSPEDFNNYFETKYSMFKQVCPTLYRKALDGSFAGTEEYSKILQLAEDIKYGRKTKAQADSNFTWWMADKYKIQERYGKKQPPPPTGQSRQAAAAKSWLFD